MNADSQLTLPDGRRLAYAEFGRHDGAPVLYFHGAPSSRLEPLLIGDDAWGRLGLRVIAPDRPGMGRSDFQPGRGFSDWPADVAALADALGLRRFAALGFSGGGPYVAACAARIPERLVAGVIVSGGWRMDWPEATRGLPFVNRLVMTLAHRCPPLLRLVLMSMGNVAHGEREKELAQLKRRLPPADFAALVAPGRLEAFGRGIAESMRQGTKGPAWDMGLYTREFGFRPEEVQVPLTLFHGTQDHNAPIALARRVAALLPGARLVAYEHESHLSTLCNRVQEIGHALVASGWVPTAPPSDPPGIPRPGQEAGRSAGRVAPRAAPPATGAARRRPGRHPRPSPRR
jgi:pimeloyl-ACP methyl ester carboxylesterase